MNDLLKRYPKNKHVLYLTSEWLYTSRISSALKKCWSTCSSSIPIFRRLNMLGYSYIEAGHPDPAKAVASLKRYIEADPSSPIPKTLSAKYFAMPATIRALSNTIRALADRSNLFLHNWAWRYPRADGQI